MSDFAYSTAIQTARAIANKDVSSRELLQASLDRVSKLDGPINAVVALDTERALNAADKADQAVSDGEVLGPLHGVPITIKDSFQTEGVTTTSGAPELSDFVPDGDADPVALQSSRSDRIRQNKFTYLGGRSSIIQRGIWDYQQPIRH